ncbi:MAG: coproporphyrinogen-III oxidase family protein [Ignavibacteriales bacterium]
MQENEKVRDYYYRAQERLNQFRMFKQSGLIPLHGNFYPAGVHYPPIVKYPAVTQEEIFRNYALPEDNKLDIYVHIPFCLKRCVFCHYPSLYHASDSLKDTYLDALEKEMDIYMKFLGMDYIRARSILVGGGTPTDLTPAQLKRFLVYFTRRVDLSKCTQFNYDVDPNTIVGPEGAERLKIMRDYGVDRLTIGIQSLNDYILRIMNRAHDVQTAIESVIRAQESGYQLNIEFIYGYPGQTIENWIEVMEKAVALQTGEIQLYRLKIEAYGDQQGKIKNFSERHQDAMPSPEETILMKQIAIDLLEDNGYKENLRRVFTKKRASISQYAFNQCCQLFDEIGLGITAFSSLRDRFILNTQYFEEYYRSIANNRLPLNRGIYRSPDQQIRWAIILPLKNYFIQKNRFLERTGVPVTEVFQEKFSLLKDYGLLTETDRRIELTKTGAFFADDIVQQFFEKDLIPYPAQDYAEGVFNPYNKLEAEILQ